MKAIVLTITTLLSMSSFAAFHNLSCEAYRISKDANQNLQMFSVDSHEVNINGVKLGYDQLVDGDLMFVDPIFPAKATYVSKEGKQFDILISFWGQIHSFEGRASVGRDHSLYMNKVRVTVSTKDKKHYFHGVCREENVTTCGGACAAEDENRDVL